jgi:DNA-binding response OmpR family regulator
LNVDTAPNVLLIDDDPQSRANLKGMVQALGYNVIMARDAKEGLDQCSECPPLAVITQLGLPHLSGLQVSYHLKARCPRTKVLLITKNDPGASGHRLRELGVDVLLQAPVRFSTLRRALWPFQISVRAERADAPRSGRSGVGSPLGNVE